MTLHESPPLVHLVVILLVVAARNVVHPLLVVKVPADCLFYAFLKLQARLPAEFALQLARVDGIAHIVALAVGDVGDEVHVFALFPSEQAVDCVYHNLDDVNVLPFVEATYVVGVCYFAIMENEVNRPCVVLDIQPVPYVLDIRAAACGGVCC